MQLSFLSSSFSYDTWVSAKCEQKLQLLYNYYLGNLTQLCLSLTSKYSPYNDNT